MYMKSARGQGHCLTFVKGHVYFETSVPTLTYKYMLILRWVIIALLGDLFVLGVRDYMY